MDNGFSVLMLIFGVAVLLYAAILSSGNHKLLPIKAQISLRSNDKRGQTRHIAAVTALVAIPIALGGLAGLFRGNTICLITMAASAAVIIMIAVIRHRNKPGADDASDPDDSIQ
jgi:hypothetical protein